MSQRRTVSGLRAFALISFGHLISTIGSGMTGFGLGVWIYQQSQSSTLFALMFFFTVLPTIVVSPLAGPLIDRWDRRTTMLLTDVGGAVAALVVLLMLAWDRLAIWHVYLFVAVNAVLLAFQRPAYSASIPVLTAREEFSRANGLMQMAQSGGHLLAPLVGGVVIAAWTIRGLLLVDLLSFLIPIGILLLVRFPRHAALEQRPATGSSLWREAAQGWDHLRRRPGLLGLMLLLGAVNLQVGLVTVLVTPMILSFTTPAVLGVVLSIAGSGMVVSSVVLSVWRGPQRRMAAILGSVLVSGLCIALAGVRQSVPLLALAGFGFFFMQPFTISYAQTIMQWKVPLQLQGRIFAVNTMITTAALPLAYLAGGPLAEQVFEPLLMRGGPLADSVGRLIGVGPGRGTGLFFVVAGVLTMLIALAGWLYRPLRRVEAELPNVEEQAELALGQQTAAIS